MEKIFKVKWDGKEAIPWLTAENVKNAILSYGVIVDVEETGVGVEPLPDKKKKKKDENEQ